MTTKTKTPEALREQAQKLAEQAAAVQAEIDAQTLREYEREQQARREAAQGLVDTFDAAALDRDVDDARHALNEAVSSMPVTQALAAYLSAQYIRNWAWADLTGARGLLGLPTGGARAAGTTEIPLDDLIVSIAQRDAQRLTDAHREEQGR
jgi:hypothetical protein